MKNFLLVFALLSTAFAGKGQNLVPNGDFEGYSTCPDDLYEFDFVLFWINPSLDNFLYGSPDYFNQCSDSIADVPNNYFGYQNAHSGLGYCGLIAYTNVMSNYREYIEAPLTSTLISNQCYQFNMYINLANTANITIDDIQIYFSDTLISGIANYLPLPFVPQISNTTGMINDTLNWTLISGNYQASGGENYLLIGNFLNDLNTTFQFTSNGSFPGAYFYIDDVSLTPCTAIEEQNQNQAITIYPNPVKDELTVNCYSLSGKKEIVITDILGKEIYRNEIKTSNFKLQTLNFIPGIYFLEINTGKEIFRKKFLKE